MGEGPAHAAGYPQVRGTENPAATGRTVVHEAAVAKVAAAAAREVPGVHSLGTAPSRALGAIRDAVVQTPSDHAAGVRAEVGQEQAAVDITLVAEYGVPLQQLADAVRAAVYRAVEGLTGLTVIEVNVEITDVFIGEARQGVRQPGIEVQ
ncbi:Asp23/Gls24 family envelope stress response protein [Sinomonas notoginsengisoli]|uniref:Asp23/Gls24 family envelope stress response protein n=1 Tax=Sinomonas notoginsengisoli TaxID=1457311 RepID=UPI001F2ADC35|nr:Asp23/Gls24 family envelope stress response protein [Sinomonas notoginsengisoli]